MRWERFGNAFETPRLVLHVAAKTPRDTPRDIGEFPIQGGPHPLYGGAAGNAFKNALETPHEPPTLKLRRVYGVTPTTQPLKPTSP